MKYCVGIDLGSTTTKALILGEEGELLGRGITNSRSNYKVACDVALGEALINARFALLSADLEGRGIDAARREPLLAALGLAFRAEQYRTQLDVLDRSVRSLLSTEEVSGPVGDSVDEILEGMAGEVDDLYARGTSRKSDFFRDLAGSRYLHSAETVSRSRGASYDRLVGFYDKAILEVENTPDPEDRFEDHALAALASLPETPPELEASVRHVTGTPLECVGEVGTGYGRQTLPFPKESIRSEILCHGLGAHSLFPATRTVLDIGGQDTKAIQIDERGIVTSFQMNDRCAAGCGRYLGYIADEMNLGLHELGPMACQSTRPVRINSTCTVFAGAELRERLSLGERREDILAGLHRAIILRAMSLLARSGGVSDEFTFTGGVAKNTAAVEALEKLLSENYGEVTINISPDSIYTGALGAALFARRDLQKASA
jgi:benzoyl-CoA reductase subunit A